MNYVAKLSFFMISTSQIMPNHTKSLGALAPFARALPVIFFWGMPKSEKKRDICVS